MVAGEVVLPELDAGVRLAPGARIGQAHRLHRPEPQRVHAAPRHHLDRQAPLEELRIVEFVQRRLLGRHHRGVKFCVLLPVHRTVQIVPLAIVDPARSSACSRGLSRLSVPGDIQGWVSPQAPGPAGGAEDFRHVDGLGEDDRADGVVEIRGDPRRRARRRPGRATPRSADRSRRSRGVPDRSRPGRPASRRGRRGCAGGSRSRASRSRKSGRDRRPAPRPRARATSRPRA